MRKFLSLVVVLAVVLAGCNEERKRVSRETHTMSAIFVREMEAGRTTREQEQAYIRSVRSVLLQLDRSIRGTKAADSTEAEAKRISGN